MLRFRLERDSAESLHFRTCSGACRLPRDLPPGDRPRVRETHAKVPPVRRPVDTAGVSLPLVGVGDEYVPVPGRLDSPHLPLMPFASPRSHGRGLDAFALIFARDSGE